jgi:hypothetical protein
MPAETQAQAQATVMALVDDVLDLGVKSGLHPGKVAHVLVLTAARLTQSLGIPEAGLAKAVRDAYALAEQDGIPMITRGHAEG